MALGHVRPHDHDAVAVGEVLLERGGATAPVRGPETRDRGAVSYARLVLDLHGAHRREELLDQVVLLVVERGASQVREAERPVQLRAALVLLLPAVAAGLDDPGGGHVPLRLERPRPPPRAPPAGGLFPLLAERGFDPAPPRRAPPGPAAPP